MANVIKQSKIGKNNKRPYQPGARIIASKYAFIEHINCAVSKNGDATLYDTFTISFVTNDTEYNLVLNRLDAISMLAFFNQNVNQ